jgi:hypothetical protein
LASDVDDDEIQIFNKQKVPKWKKKIQNPDALLIIRRDGMVGAPQSA